MTEEDVSKYVKLPVCNNWFESSNHNCVGTKKFNGNTAIGVYLNGKMNGFARINIFDGRVYSGQVITDEDNSGKDYVFPHGAGFLHVKGTSYESEFVKGVISTKGKARWESGKQSFTYEGEWPDEKTPKQSTLTMYDFEKKQKIIINGDFLNYTDGRGVIRYEGGEEYLGEFKKAQPHGMGSFVDSNKNTIVGMFENGRRSISEISSMFELPREVLFDRVNEMLKPQLCSAIRGLTVMGGSSLNAMVTMSSSMAFGQLVNNGSFRTYMSEYRDGQCQIPVLVSGFYKGNSYDRTFYCVPSNIIRNDATRDFLVMFFNSCR
jgi:hypothetical protein